MILIGDYAPGENPVTISLDSKDQVFLANLEGPLLSKSLDYSPRDKAGPVLSNTVLPVGMCRVVFSMANNHIMDYGVPGYEATCAALNQAGFEAYGAGRNIAEARRPGILDDGSVRIGLLACCETQFGVARYSQVGVAELGPWVYAGIRALRENVDVVVVSVHAAMEDSPWPSPYIREIYHSLIDAGALVVHGHHSHIPQGYEQYRDGLIFYGMGNFAVDPNRWNNYPNGMWSLAARIDFRAKPLHWNVFTLEIRHEPGEAGIIIKESSVEEREIHAHYIDQCNRPLVDETLLESLWQETALRAYFHHGARYMHWDAKPDKSRRHQIHAHLVAIKQAIAGQCERSQSYKSDYLLWYHMFACESHRQMMATALGVLGGELEDLRTEETRRMADEMMPWSVEVARS